MDESLNSVNYPFAPDEPKHDADSDNLSTHRLNQISELAYEVEDRSEYDDGNCLPLQMESFQTVLRK